jgi:ketosteroid isomerase-like protein
MGLIAVLALAASAQDANIDGVRKMARELERALIAADTGTLEKILTDDFLRRPPGGPDTNKREYLSLLSSGRLKYVAFQNVEEKFRSYPNTVLVEDVTDIRARGANGPERDTRLKLTWIWVKLDGQWRLAGVQGSPAPGH